MFQRFHAMKEERDEGFTLIELLVVILIIAILAAIAIPVFLRQREKGWVSQAESALKNAATAQESLLTTQGSYASAGQVSGVAGSGNDLADEGYKATSGVVLTIVSANAGTDYCLMANHDNLSTNYYYDSDVGKPSTTACT